MASGVLKGDSGRMVCSPSLASAARELQKLVVGQKAPPQTQDPGPKGILPSKSKKAKTAPCSEHDSCHVIEKWSGRRESNPHEKLGKLDLSSLHQWSSCKTVGFGHQ